MKILIGIFLAFVALVGLGTWISNRFFPKKATAEADDNNLEIPTDCCGAHEVCEFEQMLQNPNEIVYFEDEELDRFRGLQSEQYSDTDIEEFRDVLYTLKGDEVRMWLLSIQRRQLELPGILKQEALMLAAEA